MSRKRITINDLERIGGIEKLQRDGHTREQISKALYKETDGISKSGRQEMVNKFYDRKGQRKYYG